MSARIITGQNLKDQGVFGYKPKRIENAVSSTVTDFIRHQQIDKDTGFHINPLLADQTGVAAAREADLEAALEEKMLTKMKVIQEEAYKQGFAQGLQDGSEKAYADTKDEIDRRLDGLGKVALKMENLTKNLTTHNEAMIIDMIYYMARLVAMREIRGDRAAIAPLLSQLVDSVQQDESIVINVSEDDYAYLEDLKKKNEKNFEFLNRVKIIGTNEIQSGGCTLQTNYGMIDACLDTRVQKLWDLLQEKKPKIEEDVA